MQQFSSLHCNNIKCTLQHFFSSKQFLHFSWRVIIKIIICFWLNSVGYFTLDLQMASDDLGDVSVGLLQAQLKCSRASVAPKGFSCFTTIFGIFFGFLDVLGSSRYSRFSRSPRGLKIFRSQRSDFGKRNDLTVCQDLKMNEMKVFFCSKLILI